MPGPNLGERYGGRVLIVRPNLRHRSKIGLRETLLLKRASVALPVAWMCEDTSSGGGRLPESDPGGPCSGRVLVVGRVCDFATKLGLGQALPCKRRVIGIPPGFNMTIYVAGGEFDCPNWIPGSRRAALDFARSFWGCDKQNFGDI